MTTIINERDVSVSSSHSLPRFYADASELGWPPGHFPERLSTTLGNAQDFIRVDLNSERALYDQLWGCISLVVYND